MEGTRMATWAATEGLPSPLGVTWIAEEQAYNFALYSKHATAVTLLLYDAADMLHPVVTYEFSHLKNKSGRIWHCRISAADLRGASYYAYSIDGPNPEGQTEWHSFDPQKILLDPYANAVHFPAEFDRRAAMRSGSNAGRAPVGLIQPERSCFLWGEDSTPRHEAELVIYELHVKGFTARANSGLRPEQRGAFAGVEAKIPYLKELGVTAVQLMPVFQFDPQEGNYWGYMPLNFFSPHQQYACRAEECHQHDEFRAMVKALHAAEIEVILDVVYNHTTEADHRGPTYSFKGIDNSTYYLMTDNPHDPYANYSGTGNTLHCTNRYVRKMILDSLRYWVKDMHVDGFRFDLASVFARGPNGEVNLEDPPIFGDITSDPELADVRLIAEPWDTGMYQLGRAFPGTRWFQWNARFRDDVRRFVRGDPGLVPALMTRLYGSDDLFPDTLAEAYHPFQSVNYVAAHDGFTLYDLVAYDHKHNWANGHNNTDGPAEEFSWNCGWEGEKNVPAEVMALRERQMKNFCCLLFLSNGTPMFRAGDEFTQTQGGNSNPYNQDNETTWLDWDRLELHRDVFRFFKQMIAFRKAHPSLCRSRFWRDDVRWYGPTGPADLSYASRQLAFGLRGASQGDADLYVMINMAPQDVAFEIQEGPASRWACVIDTARETPADVREPEREPPLRSPAYVVRQRSIVVLVSRA
jgi:isoamylase